MESMEPDSQMDTSADGVKVEVKPEPTVEEYKLEIKQEIKDEPDSQIDTSADGVKVEVKPEPTMEMGQQGVGYIQQQRDNHQGIPSSHAPGMMAQGVPLDQWGNSQQPQQQQQAPPPMYNPGSMQARGQPQHMPGNHHPNMGPAAMGRMGSGQQNVGPGATCLVSSQTLLRKLDYALKSPSSPQQHQDLMDLLKRNPTLMDAYIKWRNHVLQSHRQPSHMGGKMPSQMRANMWHYRTPPMPPNMYQQPQNSVNQEQQVGPHGAIIPPGSHHPNMGPAATGGMGPVQQSVGQGSAPLVAPQTLLRRLENALKSPSSPQQHQDLMELLKRNPTLMDAYIKRKNQGLHGPQSHQQPHMGGKMPSQMRADMWHHRRPAPPMPSNMYQQPQNSVNQEQMGPHGATMPPGIHHPNMGPAATSGMGSVQQNVGPGSAPLVTPQTLLRKLEYALKSPSSPQQHQDLMDLLKRNPTLMDAYDKWKNQGPHGPQSHQQPHMGGKMPAQMRADMWHHRGPVPPMPSNMYQQPQNSVNQEQMGPHGSTMPPGSRPAAMGPAAMGGMGSVQQNVGLGSAPLVSPRIHLRNYLKRPQHQDLMELLKQNPTLIDAYVKRMNQGPHGPQSHQ